jgi:hypothetical protein
VAGLSPALLDLARGTVAPPLSRGQQRLEDPRFSLFLGRGRGPTATCVSRLRLRPGEVEAALDDVRAAMRRFERASSTWELADDATPDDLEERLLELGLTPFAEEPEVAGMVLVEPPPPAPPGIDVVPVRTVDEYVAALAIANEAFGAPAEVAAAEAADARERFADWFGPETAMFVALADGEPVASARATFGEAAVFLGAGGTLPRARGRGAYRALVAARWEAAVARGTPALVTHAGAESRPILERLGFRAVARIRVLLDEPG